MKTVKKEFCRFDSEDEAKEAEVWLANCIRQAYCYPGKRRVEHVIAGFQQIMLNLNIEQNADRVYVNINPIRYLINNGEKKLALQMAKKKYLPLSYEGLLTQDNVQSKGIPFYERPSMYDAIAYYGTRCHLFTENSPKDMKNISEGYGYSSFITSPDKIDASTKKTLEVLKNPSMDFSNMKTWLDRVVPVEHIIQANAEVLGFFNAMRHSDLEIAKDQSKKAFSELVLDDYNLRHLDILLGLLKNKSSGPFAINTLMLGPIEEVIEKKTFFALARKIKIFCDCINDIDPKRARFLTGALISNALPITFGMTDVVYKWQKEAVKDTFTTQDLLKGCNANQAAVLAEKLDIPKLLDKAHDRAKQKKIISSFDL